MIKIYETDSYQREVSTTVTECFRENGKIYLRLAETIFFPEEGGQYADTGVLIPLQTMASNAVSAGVQGADGGDGSAAGVPDRVHILDGEYRRGNIRYVVDQEIPAGTEVLGILDWDQRFSRMQQHTGEHILTGAIHRRYGYTNVGFHLSDDSPVTLDLSGPLTWEQAMEIEQEANEVIYANLPVHVYFPSREKLAKLDYRSKIEIEGQVRLIGIGEGSRQVDLCACCAPHVANTGEIGLIKIITLQNYKGGVRLGILCGARALAHYRTEWQRLTRLANALSTGVEQVPDSLASLQQELFAAKQTAASLMEAAVLKDIENIPENAAPLYFTGEVLSPVVIKNAFNALAARFPEKYVGLFIGDDTAGYRFAAGSIRRNARELAGILKEKLSAKGGGGQDMIQGKVAAGKETIISAWPE